MKSKNGADNPRFTAALPNLSWDQYVNDLLGPQNVQCGPALEDYGFDLHSSFQEASGNIEQWATGQAPCPTKDEKAAREEAYICYGTVSERQAHLETNCCLIILPMLPTGCARRASINSQS